MFERPEKKDVDYALSMLMHEARRQIAECKTKIQSEATKHGLSQNSRALVMTFDAADKIHTASMIQAKQILVDFVPRIGRPASEIIAWVKPHLENLSNTVLRQIHHSGFPQDYQRLIDQYRMAFSQRVEGTLRETEIGYIRGTGFSADTATAKQDDWISARDALSMFGKLAHLRVETICTRAHAGMIRARATRFIRDGKAVDITDIPAEFWWAEGGGALKQNWEAGDFETWICRTIRLQAFGVMFLRSEIEQALPASAQALDNTPESPTTSKISATIQQGYAFVAMPIDKNDHQLVDVLDAIKEAAKQCNVIAERVDEVESNERITDRILDSITKAEFVIVDLTKERPNVFFEAGYAHGLGKVAIYIARHGTQIHFDIKDYPIIMFHNMKELKDGISKRLTALTAKRA